MFDMGFAEMMLIGIVALLVIGPERLPAVARSAGKWFAKIKSFVNNVKNDVEREFKTDELQKMLAKQQDELQSIKEAMNSAENGLSVKEEIDKISKDLKS